MFKKRCPYYGKRYDCIAEYTDTETSEMGELGNVSLEVKRSKITISGVFDFSEKKWKHHSTSNGKSTFNDEDNNLWIVSEVQISCWIGSRYYTFTKQSYDVMEDILKRRFS